MKIEIISTEKAIRVRRPEYQELLSSLSQLDNQHTLKVTCENKKEHGRIDQFLRRLPGYKVSRRIIDGELLIFITKQES